MNENLKYRPGDRVVVRSDIVEGAFYYMDDNIESNTVIDEMLPFRGKVVTIRQCNAGQYIIEGSSWRWTDEMFEGLEDENTSPVDVGDYI